MVIECVKPEIEFNTLLSNAEVNVLHIKRNVDTIMIYSSLDTTGNNVSNKIKKIRMYKLKTRSLLQGLLMAGIVLFAFSCKKDSNADSGSYVKIQKNGTLINYAVTAGELGPDLADPNFTNLGVTASTTDGKEIFDITIQVAGTNLSTGTYNSDDANGYAGVSVVTNDGSGLHHFGIDQKSGMAIPKYTIIITSITTDFIQGTFTGNYLYDSFGNNGSDIMLVTSGEFRVKRIR